MEGTFLLVSFFVCFLTNWDENLRYYILYWMLPAKCWADWRKYLHFTVSYKFLLHSRHSTKRWWAAPESRLNSKVGTGSVWQLKIGRQSYKVGTKTCICFPKKAETKSHCPLCGLVTAKQWQRRASIAHAQFLSKKLLSGDKEMAAFNAYMGSNTYCWTGKWLVEPLCPVTYRYNPPICVGKKKVFKTL